MANTLKNSIVSIPEKRGGDTAFLLRLIDEAMPSDSAIAIAVSAGLDSMSLLHTAVRVAHKRHIKLHVFHVHHGLHHEADSWLEHVKQFCMAQKIDFDARRLDGATRQNAQSIEDWARQGRYAALSEMARVHGVHEVWLAQHEDDQIETYLLQKDRGAGARGLSAMPAIVLKHGLIWRRPWLCVSRAQIDAYAAEQKIVHIQDPSNQNLRFARNIVRLTVQKMTSDERAQILQRIEQAQQQTANEDQWASYILDQHRVPHRAEIGECSRLYGLKLHHYSEEQQAILLRSWLALLGWRMPHRAALNELRQQLLSERKDQQMCWQHPDGFAIALFQNNWIAAHLLPRGQWFLSEELAQWITFEKLIVQPRVGGERVRLHPKRPHISLKQAYQEMSVAPMLRRQLPLIYRDSSLIHVVGVGTVFDSKVVLQLSD